MSDVAQLAGALDRRQAVQARIADVGRLADVVFGTTDDPECARTRRVSSSRIRPAATMRQAGWPAVQLGEFSERHEQSVPGGREASCKFVACGRGAIAADRQP